MLKKNCLGYVYGNVIYCFFPMRSEEEFFFFFTEL